MIQDSSVLAGLKPALHQPLIAFKQQQNLGSYFQAIEVILDAYFAVASPNTSSDKLTGLVAQVTQLTSDYQALKSAVTLLQETTALLVLQQRTNTPPSGSQKSSTRKRVTQAPAANTIQGGITGVQLAKRLNSSSATLSKRRSRDDFSVWSQQQDPDGIAWEYASFTRQFHPVASISPPANETDLWGSIPFSNSS